MRAAYIGLTPPHRPPLPAERYSEIDVGFRPRTGASSRPGTGSDCSPTTDRCAVPGTPTAALSAPTGLEQTSTAPGVVLSIRRRQRKRSQARGCIDNWRCLAVENLSDVELLDGPWQTAENHSRPQNCIDEVELDVDHFPQPASSTQSPDPKSAKL